MMDFKTQNEKKNSNTSQTAVVCKKKNYWKHLNVFSCTIDKSICRWATQAMLCAGITSLLVVISPLNELFEHSGYWAVQSAVVVLESTMGASIKKSAERVFGTIVGGFLSYAIFTLITWNETLTTEWYTRVLLMIYIICWPLPWGVVRVKFPKNLLIATYGTYTGYIVVISSFWHQGVFKVVIFRILAVIIGVLVCTAVVHCVFPNSARRNLDRSIADVLDAMADILDPLVVFEAGIQSIQTVEGIKPSKETLRHIAKKRQRLAEQRQKKKKTRSSVFNGGASFFHQSSQTLVSGFNSSTRVDSQFEDTHLPIISTNKDSIKHISANHDNLDIHPSSEIPQFQKIPLLTQDLPSSIPYFFTKQRISTDSNSQQQHHHPSSTNITGGGDEAHSRRAHLDSDTSIFRTISNTSQLSTFYREQELALDILRAKTLKDVTVEYGRALYIDAEERRKRWTSTMTNLQKCQLLIASQPGLITEAKQEIWCRGPTLFPDKKYSLLLSHIHRLFQHIASLFFSLDLQLAQVSKARQQSIVAFGAVNSLDSSNRLDHFTYPALAEIQNPPDQEFARKIYAGMSAAFIFTDAYGTIINTTVRYITQALKTLAMSLLTHSDITESATAVDAAAEQINILNKLREQRQGIYSKIFTTAVHADACGRWIERKHSSFGMVCSDTSYATLPWEDLMGIAAETFRDMSKAEHEIYWECYWIARDRLSVAMGTLTLLRDQLYIICSVIGDINSCAKQL